MKNYYTEQMEIVRKLWGMNNKLRQQNNIPLSQYTLNIAYGGMFPEDYFLMPEFREELAKACEVYGMGYDLADLNNYDHHALLSEKPSNMLCIEENGLYFCFDDKQPDWLKQKQEERTKHAKEMKARKEQGVVY